MVTRFSPIFFVIKKNHRRPEKKNMGARSSKNLLRFFFYKNHRRLEKSTWLLDPNKYFFCNFNKKTITHDRLKPLTMTNILYVYFFIIIR